MSTLRWIMPFIAGLVHGQYGGLAFAEIEDFPPAAPGLMVRRCVRADCDKRPHCEVAELAVVG